MPVGESHPQALARRTAAMAASHVGGRPGLVDEHEPRRIEIELVAEPVPALPQDVRAILLDGMADVFFRVMP
jgi:hypothetical protein